MYRTIRQEVATRPFPSNIVAFTKASNGLVTATPKENLVELEVVADSPTGVVVGDKILVPIEYSKLEGLRKLRAPGIGEFILVPVEHIFLVIKKTESTEE